jgi:hypothetical protein
MEKESSENGKNLPGSSIFSQKSLSRINGPEELNAYVRVTTPSIWIVLAAIALLVTGILGWCLFGTVAVHEADGSVREVRPITFIMN